MWIVAYALKHRYTIGVLAILILLFGGMAMKRMSTDILPAVEVPSVNVVWTYGGLNAREFAAKISSFSEIAILNNVDDVREVRSETINGVAVVKVDFQSHVDIDLAISQITSVSQTILRRMPPGTQPPIIVRYSRSSVPILQLVLASDTLNDGQLFDFARLQLRAQIQTIPGVRMSLPYGGAARQIMVELDPRELAAYGLSPAEVSRAIAAQNLTLPSGLVREGGRELQIAVNASPVNVAGFENLPIREVDGRVIFLRDVAAVRDGPAVQTNVARLNGQNSVMVSIIKLGAASTVDIVRQINQRLPEIRASAPPGVTIEPIFDQSVFVDAAIGSVVKEAVIVALMVASVVLLFLGSLRSTLIVLTSIPLALLASIWGLHLAGHTFNLMSLGGLALAIGILVDNALVEIENINRNVDEGKPLREAILAGAQQVVFPEFVSTLCVCIVFIPIFLLTGVASYVFQPLALAVVFAMAASFLLSRTLVPTLAYMLLPREIESKRRTGSARAYHRVEAAIERLRAGYGRSLDRMLRRRSLIALGAAAVVGLGALGAWNLGREFFPVTDAGLMKLHVRAPSGTRLEETARLFADIQREIRALVPARELAFVAENIGSPEPVNLAWIDSTVVGAFEGEILVQLTRDHGPSAQYMAAIRAMLKDKFPQVRAYFRPADATSQTLAGGAPAALDVRLVGRNLAGNLQIAREIERRMLAVPGAVDVTLRQVLDLPEYFIEVDRVRALQLGITSQEAANAILAALGAGGTVAPSFWADPRGGASYSVQVQSPPASLDSIEALLNMPVRTAASGNPITLRTIATVSKRQTAASVSRVTLAPAINVVANVQGRDLGGVYSDVSRIVSELRPRLEPGNRIEIEGQAEAMDTAYRDLAGGLALAAVLVFLVMVVNFQSWAMPAVAMSGQPLAIAGAALGLWATGTPLSVPALMGIIMVVGVSAANSVLVTSFARDRLLAGASPREAALQAATTRLRPVLMTAAAMIVGIIPMALGLGEGGEQNAPLGRAVIGGLLLGTAATLIVVPIAFSLIVRPRRAALQAAAQAAPTTDVQPTPEPST
jgi:CzcA family heavy metal efflux pump